MKKASFVLSLLLALSLLLSACAQPAAPAPAADPEKIIETVEVEKTVIETKEVIVTQEVQVEIPAKRTEVRLSGWTSSPEETALLESLLYKFSVANPDIVVKYEPITGDYWATLKTMIASETEPDICYMDIFQFLAFAQDEVLLPLDDLMASTGIKREDFIPSLTDAFTYDGKTYGIPKDFNTLGLFYNKELFAKAGLEEPTDEWTWDDLKAAAEKLTDLSDSNKPVYGLGVPADPGRFPIFAFQNGGAIMNDDFSDTLVDTPEVLGAAEFYTSFRKDKIGTIPADVGEGWQGTAFGKGQFAMVFEGGWLIPYLTKQFPQTQFGVVNPPAGPKGEGNLIFTVSWSISNSTQNPEAAWKVIEFLTSEEAQNIVLQSGFALPSRVSLQESEYLKNNPASAAIFRGAMAGARPFLWGLVGSDVNDQLTKALERVYLEDMPVPDSLTQAADEIRAKIEENK